MQLLRFLYNLSKRQWIRLLCLILIAYLARLALAQDTVIPEGTATPPVASSEIEPVPVEIVVEPVEPIQVVDPIQPVDAPVVPEPTQQADLIASPEPVLLPTTLPDVEVSATPVAPIETAASPEITLTPVLENTGVMVEPTIVDVATVTPVVVIEMQPTALPLEVSPVTEIIEEASPIIPIVDTTILQSHLSGSIQVSHMGVDATVTIVGAETQQTVAVQSDGSFALDVRPGDYQLIITAQSHLPYVLEVSISDQAVVLPTITLVNNQMGGEIIRLIVQNFGMTGPSAADVNGDMIVNVYDLAIVGSSLR